jgi:hypothetical protein
MQKTILNKQLCWKCRFEKKRSPAINVNPGLIYPQDCKGSMTVSDDIQTPHRQQ